MNFKKLDDMTDIIDSERKRKHVITKEDLVKRFFFKLITDGEIDYALPIEWVKHVYDVTKEEPKLFVTFYPQKELIQKYGASELFYPLCKESLDLLKTFNEKSGCDYPVPSE
jgi:predicted membrane-bound dolichyl-phosphate-mannose-protein mannosyltransferase